MENLNLHLLDFSTFDYDNGTESIRIDIKERRTCLCGYKHEKPKSPDEYEWGDEDWLGFYRVCPVCNVGMEFYLDNDLNDCEKFKDNLLIWKEDTPEIFDLVKNNALKKQKKIGKA